MANSSSKLYVQYGAGNADIPGWVNYDSSPTLRIQKIPILGSLLKKRLNCVFDDAIVYGDIVKGLPLRHASVDGLFCSHVLEHLTRADFDVALSNSFNYLKPGGTFRIIVPDLRIYIKEYIEASSSNDDLTKANAAEHFCRDTYLGRVDSRSTLLSRINAAFSNNVHQWMWDYEALSKILDVHGFVNIRPFIKGNAEDKMFLRPERDHQFDKGICIACERPKEHD